MTPFTADLINRLTFEYDSLDDTITTIDKGGVLYERSSVDSAVYKNDVDRITKTAAGYRWENTWGEWRDYDETGRMTAYGNRSGIVGTVSYETGENGTATGITDRNARQVLWFEYTGDDLTAVYDLDNRRVEYTYTGGRLTTVTDVFGNDTTYAYDAKDRLATITDAENRTVTVTYDNYGNPASVKDENGVGHTFEFDYDEAKKETYARITYPAGIIKEVWYDRDGRATRVDRNGTTLYTFVRDGRNLIITDENNAVTRKEFNEWGKLTRVLYPDGTEVSYEYDAQTKRRSKETDERGIVTTYTHDTSGNLIRKVEANGAADERITEHTYDADGNLLTRTTLGDAVTPEAQTTNTYDADGNLQTVTDPEGNTTRFTAYDIRGNVLTKIDGRGKTWTYTYDNAGRLKTVTDPLSHTTEYVYDKVGNKTKEIDAAGKETTYTYDSRDRVITSTDTGGNTTMYDYNGDGKLTKQTDPDGKTITYQYDADGRLAKTIDGAGNEITMEYDGAQSGCSTCGGGTTEQPSRIIYPTFTREMTYDLRGRKTKERDVLDTETTETYYTYDETGNLIEKTDREGKTTVYTYDDRNRLMTVTDPDQNATAYTYDDRDNLLTLTDGENHTTVFEYDRNNRLTQETRPMGEETTYQYDENGNLIEKTDAKNQLTAYTYDDAGRLETIRYYNAADHTTPVKTVIFTYDSKGNLTGYDDGTTSATYGYDAAYRKTTETVNYGTFAATNTYTYKKNGTKKTFTGPDNITYTYTYDSANRISSVTIPNQGSITWPAYTWNRPQTITLPGGSQKNYTYDSLMRVTDITMKDPGQNNLLHYQYDYDMMDNIISKETEHGTYTYQYDNLYRLTEADNPIQTDETYTYDAVGNRITSAQTQNDWTYNHNNELETSDDTTYEYDANGNMTKKTVGATVTSYVYNTEDRLTEVWNGTIGSGTIIATYYYDPFGRRLWKEVSGVKTCFVYADEGLVGEYDATGTEIRSYGYKPGSTWTTDPLFMKENGTYYFYQSDHLGTPQKLIATNGAVVWSATYESFGKAQVDGTSTVTNNLRFPGQYYDVEMGLHYNYFRYYDPEVGRFIRLDPVGFIGGTNFYLYVLNNPIKMSDVNGLKPSVCKEVGRRIVPNRQSADPLYSYEGERIWTYESSCVESSDVCYCMYKSTSRKMIDVFKQYPTTYEVSYECEDKCLGQYSITKKEEDPPLKPTWESTRSVPAPYQMQIRPGFTNDFIHCSCEPLVR